MTRLTGRKLSKEHRDKVIKNLVRGHWEGKKLSDAHKKKISEAHKGMKHKPMSEEGKRNIGIAQKGRKFSKETREKLSKALRGEKSSLWKGGIYPKNKAIRNSLQYRLWRESVFERDDYTCVFCGARSRQGRKVILNSDHIKPFAFYPELRFDINNGRTLCVDCHVTTSTFKSKKIMV